MINKENLMKNCTQYVTKNHAYNPPQLAYEILLFRKQNSTYPIRALNKKKK